MAKAKAMLVQGVILALAAAAIPGAATWRSASLTHREVLEKQASDAALRARELAVEETKARDERCRGALEFLEADKMNPALSRVQRARLTTKVQRYAEHCFDTGTHAVGW